LVYLSTNLEADGEAIVYSYLQKPMILYRSSLEKYPF